MSVQRILSPYSIWVSERTGGKEGYSVCARIYEAKADGKRGARHAVKVVDTLFFLDKQHCRKSWLRRQK